MKNVAYKNKRGNLRYPAEKNTLIEIDPIFKTNGFNPAYVGLVCDESFTGCGFIALKTDDVIMGRQLKVRVGNMDPIKAQIQWISELDYQVVRVGLKYLES